MVVKILESFGRAKKSGEFLIRFFDIPEDSIKILRISSYWELERKDLETEKRIIMILTRGEGKVLTDGKITKVKAWDIVIFKEGEKFKIVGNFDAVGVITG